MKIYSEVLKTLFDTPEECMAAEKEAADKEAAERARKEQEEAERKARQAKAAEERKAAAEAVTKAREKYEAARAECDAAKKEYGEALDAFCKKYGAYHYTVDSSKGITGEVPYLSDVLNLIFGGK